MKTEMTSVDVAALVYELNNVIGDSRIENIYQTTPKTLILRLHKPGQPAMQLLIEAGKRVHLTSYILTKPPKPPAFCMALRKHLRNGKIKTVEQHEFERTIVFRISTRDGVLQLVIELFGEGNIILVNQQGNIIAAQTYRRMRDRNVIRNETFRQAPPSGKNPYLLDRSQMNELKNFGQVETVRGIARFLSVGGLYSEELLLRAGVNKGIPCQELTERQLDGIFTELKTILSHLTEGKFDPAIIIDSKGEWVDATPISLKRYEGLKRKPHKTFNEALDEYYTQTQQVAKLSVAQRDYERELAKQQRMLQDQQKTIEDSRKAKEQDKRIGDLIYAHLGELQLLAQRILDEKQRGQTWEQISGRLKEEKQANGTPAVYFDSLDTKRMVLYVSIEGNVFPLKMNRSIQENASDYYERMKKAEGKLKGSEKALRETQNRVQELREHWTEKIQEVQEEVPPKHVEKAWYEKFRWFCSSDGFLVVGGRDATTNEILIKKYLDPQDIVFHADIVGAPFVVVKAEGKPPSEQVIQEAAQFAASYSRAWREMLSAINVYWVHPDQVSKTPPHGQYLEKGSFIIQGVKNHVKGVGLCVGIGIQQKEESFKAIGGPAQTVSKQTSVYVEVYPGRQPSSELAKQIRSLLLQKAPKSWREKILAIPNETLQSFIPFGKGEVILK